MKYRKAFTLIEVLVSLSILGLIMSVTMAYVNQTKRKSDDASIQTLIESISLRASTFYNQKAKYSGVCENPEINAMIKKIEDISIEKSDVVCKVTVGSGFDDRWMIYAKSRINSSLAYCADSYSFSALVDMQDIKTDSEICPQAYAQN